MLLSQDEAKDKPEEGESVIQPNVTGLTGLGDIDGTNKSAKDRNKRSKKDGAVSPSLGSAGSLEEPVRSQ